MGAEFLGSAAAIVFIVLFVALVASILVIVILVLWLRVYPWAIAKKQKPVKDNEYQYYSAKVED